MERFTRSWLLPDYNATTRRGVDFESSDGRRLVDIKLGAQGVRDLYGAVMHLALLLEEDVDLEEACLVIRFPRLTLNSAREAWVRSRGLLHPHVASRLAIVIVGDKHETWFDPRTKHVAEIARAVSGTVDARDTTSAKLSPASPRFFEIWKVLLNAWLRNEQALHVGHISNIVGCSYPTVMQAIELLQSRGELSEETDHRRVALRSFPVKTFEQGAGLADTLRKTRWFADASGRPPDPNSLLRRLQRACPPSIALGGVVAARKYDPRFDLHGTPRLDLSYWAPYGAPYNTSFLKAVDAGLRPGSRDTAVLAVHRLSRTESCFEPSENDSLPYADPTEVLLDLHDLQLHDQANALIHVLREGRPS